jgi:hypothetical protein
MKKAWFVFLAAMLVMVSLLCIAKAETARWQNPTTAIDNTGATIPLSAEEQAALKNYLRYRIPPATTWTYFAETSGGETSWTGNLPVAAGVAAEYSVSAALKGKDGIERDGKISPPFPYTVPFPPGPTPGSPSGMTMTRP